MILLLGLRCGRKCKGVDSGCAWGWLWECGGSYQLHGIRVGFWWCYILSLCGGEFDAPLGYCALCATLRLAINLLMVTDPKKKLLMVWWRKLKWWWWTHFWDDNFPDWVSSLSSRLRWFWRLLVLVLWLGFWCCFLLLV